MEENAKIYVAGHRGLVGSAIQENLKRKGCENLIGCTHKELDLLDSITAKHFFDEEQPEYVILAATHVRGIMVNSKYRADSIYRNLRIQQNMIGENFCHGVKKLLSLGGACIYPRDAKRPMREDALLAPPLGYMNKPYTTAKVVELKICESFNLQYGTNYITMILVNLYGPNGNSDLERNHVLLAMIQKIHLGKCLNEGDWRGAYRDLDAHPVGGIDGHCSQEEVLLVLVRYGASSDKVELWGAGKPFREFLWSEEMAGASVYIMEYVDFKDIYSRGDTGIRDCHINIGTRKEISIATLTDLIMRTTGYQGKVESSYIKPDGTICKSTDVTKLHELGWHHRVDIEDGVRKMCYWYLDTVIK